MFYYNNTFDNCDCPCDYNPLNVLAVGNNATQTTLANTNLTFNATYTINGDKINLKDANTILVSEANLYLVAYQVTIKPNENATVTNPLQISLLQNGNIIPNSTTTHQFNAISEQTTLSATTIIKTPCDNTMITIQANQADYSISNLVVSIYPL